MLAQRCLLLQDHFKSEIGVDWNLWVILQAYIAKCLTECSK